MFEHKYKLAALTAVLIVMLTVASCKTGSNGDGFFPGADAGVNKWLIPQDKVKDGGPGKDGIPALENPEYIPVSQVTTLNPNDLVVGIRINGQVLAFPHRILDYHEIVNDAFGATGMVLSYCPLTGSAMAWKEDGTGEYTFGVSGLLYNSNLILYDRLTDSYWSQMFLLCVRGARSEEEPKMMHVIETSWSSFRMFYPNAMVLSQNTGYSPNYSQYPYGDYKTSNRLIFEADNPTDTRLHKKERVHGIIKSLAKTTVYPINHFPAAMTVFEDTIDGMEVVVAGSSEKNFAVSFLMDGNAPASFTALQDQLPVILEDNEGNKWDVFGKAVSGPRAGDQLTPTTSFTAYWFAWTAFYPGSDIYPF